ncbi:calmodulin-binding family protein [Raphanus sativus]|nr:calmodulin-binding family protein [Raphanus sativus]
MFTQPKPNVFGNEFLVLGVSLQPILEEMGLSLSLLVSACKEVWSNQLSSFKNPVESFLGTRSFSRGLTSRTNSFKSQAPEQNSPKAAGMERSLSFNNWEIPTEEVNTEPTTNQAEDDQIVGVEKKPKRNSLNGRTCERIQIMKPTTIIAPPKPFVFFSPRPLAELDAAATTLQKVYKSYRTRRNLADCAVVVEELWWKTLDSAALKLSSVSFFEEEKHETAIDPRHRYGHNLHFYYDVWSASMSAQPFFYWLDVGDGKDINLEHHPRSVLQKQCIKYLGPMEREAYEVIVEDGRLMYKQNMTLVSSTEESKTIFVLSTTRTLYVGQKKKGVFQHSSFLSGGATTAAGRLVARDGVLEAIWPYSGHYQPTEDNFNEFISFLEENNVDLTNVKRCTVNEEYSSFKYEEETKEEETENEHVDTNITEDKEEEEKETQRPVFELSKRLSCKWTSGVGPRIGCVRDYPMELQSQAFEQVSLSPRISPASARFPSPYGPIPSPRPSPRVRVSPRLAYMGIPSPRVQVNC